MPQFPNLHTWDEDFLQTLPFGEVSYIDYKASKWLTFDDKWRDNISTYLSAFANYDGGYLVIGVPDPVKHGGVRPDGGVQDDLKGGVVQWVENVLPGLVERPIDRIDIWPVRPRANESSIRAGHSVLVIHVPASEGAPHQARDGRYYTRHGSRRDFLGHRAIIDIIGRRKHPTVKVLSIHLTWSKNDEFVLSAMLENTSTVLARFCSVVVDLPVFVGENVMLSYKGSHQLMDDGFTSVRVNLHNFANSPLFPLSTKALTAQLECGLRETPPGFDRRPLEQIKTIANVRFKAFADEMPFVEGSLPIDKVLVRLE